MRTSETQTFEREPGRTADPSAALGMTKGRAALPCTAAKQTLGREEGGVFASAYLATTIYGSVTLPFVIPRGCDFIDSGAAVSFCPSDLTAPNKSHRPPLCHPERSRGICGAPRLPHKGLGFVSSHTHSLAQFLLALYGTA